MIRLDIGGGSKPRPGFTNVDLCDGADVHCDLERERLPFEDDSVSEVFSSHALEHVGNIGHVFREIARVCRADAVVEVRVPHWLSSMAMCPGHRHTISERQMRHVTDEFIEDWWAGCRKRLRLLRLEYIPSSSYEELQGLFPGMTREQVMRFVPDACHEIRYHLAVVPNERREDMGTRADTVKDLGGPHIGGA
jgi:SAM-dependent methyltransferase